MAWIRTQEDEGVKAIVVANADFRKLSSVAKALLQFSEVRNIYVITGKSNLAIEITAKTVRSFHEFLTVRLSNIEGLSIVSSNMITQMMKSNGKTMNPLDSAKYSDSESEK